MASSSQMMRVNKEIRDLQKGDMEGIVPVFDEFDVFTVLAYLQGPAGTPFEGAFFKVSLTMGPDFPSAPPKGLFLTRIFHPNVSEKGEICVNTLKKDWRPDVGLRQVLLTIKCLLMMPNAESALNEEAGRLLLEDYEGYFRRAKLHTSVHGLKSLPSSVLAALSGDENTAAVGNEAASSSESVAAAVAASPSCPVQSLVEDSSAPLAASSASAPKKSKEALEAEKKKQLDKKRTVKRL